MRRLTILLAVAVVLASACGTPADLGADRRVTTSVVIPQPVPVLPPLRDASPAQPVEPLLTPVPEPAPEPPAKPIRSVVPTPPPPRPRPAPAPRPRHRIPPAADTPILISPRDDLVAGAVSDLAQRLGRDPSDIDVLDARRVTWRDGSIGCPVPGVDYTEAEAPGVLIVLRVDDTSYRYHAAEGSSQFLCETPQAPLEGSA